MASELELAGLIAKVGPDADEEEIFAAGTWGAAAPLPTVGLGGGRSARLRQVRRAWEPFFLLATRVIP